MFFENPMRKTPLGAGWCNAPRPVLRGRRAVPATGRRVATHPYKLLSEFASLKKRYWGQHLWGRGYWVASSGNVTDEVWQKYIEDQKPEVPDDNFKVV